MNKLKYSGWLLALATAAGQSSTSFAQLLPTVPSPASPAPASSAAPTPAEERRSSAPAPSGAVAPAPRDDPSSIAAAPASGEPVAPAALPAQVAPLAAIPVAAAAQAEGAPTLAATAGRGLTVTSADKNFAITLRARMQLRTTVTTHEERDTDLEASLRTLRFFVAGHVLVPELKYLVQLAFASGDFERDSSSPIFDAFVEYSAIRDLNVRVGQYFVPFDRARTIREFALQLVDRQQVVRELSLDRDFGLMLSSADLLGLSGRLAYNLFVGSGDGRNRVLDSRNPHGAQKPGVLLVARLMVRPFGAFDDDQEGDLTRGATPRLALGVAGAYSIASNRDKSSYGATFTAGTFDYAHAAADLVFKLRGFSLLAELLYRNADHRSNSALAGAPAMPISESSRSGYGYLTQAGQMLTSRLELAARWEELFAKESTDRAFRDSTALNGRQVGGGLNLYLNGHLLKLQTDYFYIFGTRHGRESHVARLQLDASF